MGRLNKKALGFAILIVYFGVVAALPLLDYRGRLFFYLLALFMLSPFALLSLGLGIASAYAMAAAIIGLRHGDRSSISLLAVSAVLLFVNGFLIFRVIVPVLGPAPPRWFTHGELYHAIASPLFMVLVLILFFVLTCVPAYAVVAGFARLSRRQWSGLLYLAIVALGFGLYKAGEDLNDTLTIRSCIRELGNETRRLAICPLEGPWSDGQYVAYDRTNASPPIVIERLAHFLNKGCQVNARRMSARYYWVNEVC